MSRASAAARRPVFTALLCIASQFLLTLLILKAGRAFAPPEAFGKVKLVAFASTVLLPLLLVQLFGLWSDIGFELRSLKPSPVFWVSLLSGVIFLSMGVHPQEHGSIGG